MNNHVAEPFQSILNNACARAKANKKPKKLNCPVLYPKTSEFINGFKHGKDEMWDEWEAWLKEVFSVENIYKIIIRSKNKDLTSIDKFIEEMDLAKAIHNLTKQEG